MVRSTATLPASSMAASMVWRPRLSGTPCAAAAISRMTVSMVPSTGSFTARYAAAAPSLMACLKWSALSSSEVAHTSQMPRMICDRMTPELPRAPISEPLVTAAATSGMLSASLCRSSSTTARMVSARFVPVSPSGTGYTFRSLMTPRSASTAASAASMAASAWPLTFNL